jgi:5,10-methylenetetrahydromethanopterin reductase
VGADVSRLGKCMARGRRSAQAAGRDPNRLRFGAFINCVVHPDPEVAREAIRGGLSTFARFSGVKGMSVEVAGKHETYDMAGHGKAESEHARALDPAFIHEFGIAGPARDAAARFVGLRDLGLDFVRVVPGSRDINPAVAVQSLQTIAREIIPVVSNVR